jgi:hypothetical protein
MSAPPTPVIASASEAMALVHAALSYLATTDATAMSAEERARCLREMEQADSAATAATTSVLGAFAAGQDYTEDGDYSPCPWLIHRTKVTKGTAANHTGWMKRGASHLLVLAALAAMAVSKSYAQEICWWTDKLPEESRPAADEILLGAAASGLELADLAGLAAETYERSRQDIPDTDGPDGAASSDMPPPFSTACNWLMSPAKMILAPLALRPRQAAAAAVSWRTWGGMRRPWPRLGKPLSGGHSHRVRACRFSASCCLGMSAGTTCGTSGSPRAA